MSLLEWSGAGRRLGEVSGLNITWEGFLKGSSIVIPGKARALPNSLHLAPLFLSLWVSVGTGRIAPVRRFSEQEPHSPGWVFQGQESTEICLGAYDPQPSNSALSWASQAERLTLPPVAPPGGECPSCGRVGSEGVEGKGDLDPGLLLASCVT